MTTRAIWIGSAAVATVVAVPLFTKLWRTFAASRDGATGKSADLNKVIANTLKQNSETDTPMKLAFEAAMGQ